MSVFFGTMIWSSYMHFISFFFVVSGNVIYSNYCIAFFMFQLHSKCPSEITKSQRLQLLVTLLCMMVLRTLRSDGATSWNDVDTIRIPKWDWTNGCFVHSLLMIRLPRRVFILSFPCSKKNYKVLSLKPDGRPFSNWFWKIGAKLWGMGNGYFIKHPFSNDKCSRWFQENDSETMDSVDWDWCFFYASRLP